MNKKLITLRITKIHNYLFGYKSVIYITEETDWPHIYDELTKQGYYKWITTDTGIVAVGFITYLLMRLQGKR